MQWNEFLFHIRHLPTFDHKLIQKAFELGAQAHAPQKRQSGEPYFTHPIAVAQMLAQMGADRDTIIAALLHDTVEDTPLTLDDIIGTFNPTVGMLIDGVTKLSEEDMGENPTLDEQIETLRKMFNLMQKDVRIMVIKLADRLHNMQTIAFRSLEKQKSVARETMDVYVKIADRLCMRDVRDDLENMSLAILDPVMHSHLQDMRKKNEERSRIIIPYMRDALEKAFREYTGEIELEYKSWDGLRRQYEIEQQSKHSSSVINIAIICDDIDACYRTMGRLHRLWQREILSFEDYINAPIINGYKGLHTTIILDDGFRIRCKIRTKDMQEYAHKGITVHSFGKQSGGLLNNLQWTSRISPLSKDTIDRSKEFWQSLQNDILGESILIHGEGDQTQLMPKGATVLDGIFYLYGARGLNTKEIFVNGKSVPFYEELQYASTLTASFAPASQAELQWLQYSKTGIGTARIRSGLAEQPRDVKLETGQNVLQSHLSSRRRGFITEFAPDYIARSLRAQGYPSLEEVYVQIAEGRISPLEVEQAVFNTQSQKTEQEKSHFAYSIICKIPISNKNSFLDVLRFYTIKSFRMLNNGPTHNTFRVSVLLSDEEYRTLVFTLDHVIKGMYRIRRSSAFYKMSIFSALLFILWGLDPAIAHVILKNPNISAIDMTIVRFLSLSVLSGLFLLWMRLRNPLPEARLSLRNTSLWLSVILLFCVSITTYLSLEGTLPSHYTIPMTSAGLMLTSLVNKRRVWTLVATWALMFVSLGLLIYQTPEWNAQSILFTILAVLSFTGFSIVSERYKRQEKVSLRAAQYFFLLSVLSMVLSFALIPASTLGDIAKTDLAYMILFSIFISGIPYYIYYYLLSHKEIDFVLRYSFVIIPMTMLGEILFVGMPALYVLVAAVLVAIGAFLPLLRFNPRHKEPLSLQTFAQS